MSRSIFKPFLNDFTIFEPNQGSTIFSYDLKQLGQLGQLGKEKKCIYIRGEYGRQLNVIEI